MLYIYVLVLFC